jgi:hypothetical protein
MPALLTMMEPQSATSTVMKRAPRQSGVETSEENPILPFTAALQRPGLVGADPEQQPQARYNGSNFTVLFRRQAALLEKRRRGMGLESRVASHCDYRESEPASTRKGLSHAEGRPPGQFGPRRAPVSSTPELQLPAELLVLPRKSVGRLS